MGTSCQGRMYRVAQGIYSVMITACVIPLILDVLVLCSGSQVIVHNVYAHQVPLGKRNAFIICGLSSTLQYILIHIYIYLYIYILIQTYTYAPVPYTYIMLCAYLFTRVCSYAFICVVYLCCVSVLYV